MNEISHKDHLLVVASGNAGKLREISDILSPLGWTVRPQGDWGIPEAVEDGLSFIENALIKARHASRLTGHAALADDSGLSVDALDGAPGIYSARYADDEGDEANNRKLLEALRNVPDERRGAHFYCAMALVRHEKDPAPLVAIGRWDGKIAHRPSGGGGFGYDPLFLIDGRDCTSAELLAEDKNRLSHRGQALREMVGMMRDELSD